jgi:lipoprotein
MKKTLLLLLTLGMVVGCSSPEKEAQKLITRNLQETLDDWSSYESVKFSYLDSAFTSVQENEHYAVAYHRYDSLLKSAKENSEKMIFASNQWETVSYKNRVESDLNMANNYYNLAHRIDSMFVPEFKGWAMIHTYRANNVLGAKIITKEKYTFDPEITKIIKIEKVDGD